MKIEKIEIKSLSSAFFKLEFDSMKEICEKYNLPSYYLQTNEPTGKPELIKIPKYNLNIF